MLQLCIAIIGLERKRYLGVFRVTMPVVERTVNNANAIRSPQAILSSEASCGQLQEGLSGLQSTGPKKQTGSTHKAIQHSTLRSDDDLAYRRGPNEEACTLTKAKLKGELL
jgi:hypothetical protein